MNEFVRALKADGRLPAGAVVASLATGKLLDSAGVTILALDDVEQLYLYVDGADEIDSQGRMIKGGGGAHTAEKRIALASERFVCIADESKLVERLGETRPVPLEVLAAELAYVTKELAAMGARSDLRQQRTDSGNLLVDVTGLDLSDPQDTEQRLESISGVVASGIFASRRADIALVGHGDGSVEEVRFSE